SAHRDKWAIGGGVPPIVWIAHGSRIDSEIDKRVFEDMGNFNQADFSPDSSVRRPLSGSSPWLGGEVYLVGDPGTNPKPDKGGEPSDFSSAGRSLFGSLLKNSLTPEAMARLLPTLLKNPEFRSSMAEFMEDPKIRETLLSTFTELMKKDEFKATMAS